MPRIPRLDNGDNHESQIVSEKFGIIRLSKEFQREVVSRLRKAGRTEENQAFIVVSVRVSVDADTLCDISYTVFDPPTPPAPGGDDETELPF